MFPRDGFWCSGDPLVTWPWGVAMLEQGRCGWARTPRAQCPFPGGLSPEPGPSGKPGLGVGERRSLSSMGITSCAKSSGKNRPGIIKLFPYEASIKKRPNHCQCDAPPTTLGPCNMRGSALSCLPLLPGMERQQTARVWGRWGRAVCWEPATHFGPCLAHPPGECGQGTDPPPHPTPPPALLLWKTKTASQGAASWGYSDTRSKAPGVLLGVRQETFLPIRPSGMLLHCRAAPGCSRKGQD